ncbi:MAG TPA: HemK/PrmC family methyltransferase [Actinomycetota bacterium]|nr:HemK/PrmC family methyltransferase [Actinomycetota bacterium]
MPTIEDLLDQAEDRIKKSKHVDLWRPSDARVNAEELLSEVLGKEVTSEMLDDSVGSPKAQRFEKMVRRRVAGEPIAFIVGHTEFRGLKMPIRKDVFVPRNSSELLAEKAIAKIRRRQSPVAVDVATGIGPVAMAVANEVKRATVYGLDIWAPSIKLAKDNAKALGVTNVKFLESDMLKRLPSKLKGRIDVFTIHPPYVARSAVRTLPKEIKGFEPKVSLTDDSKDGLGLVRSLANEAPEWLSKNGWVMVEVSPDLSRQVGTILRHAGLSEVKSERDSLGATRVVSGKL